MHMLSVQWTLLLYSLLLTTLVLVAGAEILTNPVAFQNLTHKAETFLSGFLNDTMQWKIMVPIVDPNPGTWGEVYYGLEKKKLNADISAFLCTVNKDFDEAAFDSADPRNVVIPVDAKDIAIGTDIGADTVLFKLKTLNMFKYDAGQFRYQGQIKIDTSSTDFAINLTEFVKQQDYRSDIYKLEGVGISPAFFIYKDTEPGRADKSPPIFQKVTEDEVPKLTLDFNQVIISVYGATPRRCYKALIGTRQPVQLGHPDKYAIPISELLDVPKPHAFTLTTIGNFEFYSYEELAYDAGKDGDLTLLKGPSVETVIYSCGSQYEELTRIEFKLKLTHSNNSGEYRVLGLRDWPNNVMSGVPENTQFQMRKKVRFVKEDEVKYVKWAGFRKNTETNSNDGMFVEDVAPSNSAKNDEGYLLLRVKNANTTLEWQRIVPLVELPTAEGNSFHLDTLSAEMYKRLDRSRDADDMGRETFKFEISTTSKFEEFVEIQLCSCEMDGGSYKFHVKLKPFDLSLPNTAAGVNKNGIRIGAESVSRSGSRRSGPPNPADATMLQAPKLRPFTPRDSTTGNTPNPTGANPVAQNPSNPSNSANPGESEMRQVSKLRPLTERSSTMGIPTQEHNSLVLKRSQTAMLPGQGASSQNDSKAPVLFRRKIVPVKSTRVWVMQECGYFWEVYARVKELRLTENTDRPGILYFVESQLQPVCWNTKKYRLKCLERPHAPSSCAKAEPERMPEVFFTFKASDVKEEEGKLQINLANVKKEQPTEIPAHMVVVQIYEKNSKEDYPPATLILTQCHQWSPKYTVFEIFLNDKGFKIGDYCSHELYGWRDPRRLTPVLFTFIGDTLKPKYFMPVDANYTFRYYEENGMYGKIEYPPLLLSPKLISQGDTKTMVMRFQFSKDRCGPQPVRLNKTYAVTTKGKEYIFRKIVQAVMEAAVLFLVPEARISEFLAPIKAERTSPEESDRS